MKTCATCCRRKTEREFYAHETTRDRLSQRCRECERAYQRVKSAERFARTNPWAAGTRPRRAEAV